MSDVCKINVSKLKSYETEFNKELNNFYKNTYNTFSSGYLKKCADNYVRRMANKLEIEYNKIKKGYDNIDKWWKDYNKNIEGLENYLSDNGTVGVISESSIRSSASNLPELQKYNISLAGTFALNSINTPYTTQFLNNSAISTDLFSTLYTDYEVNEINQIENVEDVISNDNIANQITESVSSASIISENWISEIGASISNGVKSVVSDITNWGAEVSAWWSETAFPWIKTASEDVWSLIKSVGATVGTIALSLIEGIFQFVGAIINMLVIVGAAIFSIPTGIVDGVQAIYGAATGNDWSSVTKWMWDDVKANVSKKIVSPIFDSIYETDIGKWLQENTNNFPIFKLLKSVGIMEENNGFETTRSVASGVGYIAGVVILTILTCGAGATVAAGSTTTTTAVASTLSTEMAVTAGAAGLGKNAQEAWAAGANTLEGLGTGFLGGLWEGFQFYVGGKISGLNLFGTKGVVKSIALSEAKTKFLNSTARVILDGADGGLEGFVAPALQSIYKDGYFDENGNYIEFLEDQDFVEKYKELFDNNGGWETVWTQAKIGSFASLLGELIDLKKFVKEDTSSIMDDVETEKLFDYDASQSTIDMFVTENMDADNDGNTNKTVKIEPALKDMIDFDERNLLKYEQQIKDLASCLGISYEEVYEVLNEKVKELIDTSDFGIRTSNDVLELILDEGRFKNQFETNTSNGVLNPSTRSDVEQEVINVPKDTLNHDRPVYGMCFPEVSSKLKNISDVFVTLPRDVKNYYVNGPGNWYGNYRDGAVCIFKKDSVIDNVSFTLGDSLGYSYSLVASPASNPRFCGGFPGIFEYIYSLDKLKNIKLTELMPESVRYLELHYHGVATHSIDNLEMVIFLSTPGNEIIEKLKSKGIQFKIIT